jgi:hypothetical protein
LTESDVGGDVATATATLAGEDDEAEGNSAPDDTPDIEDGVGV